MVRFSANLGFLWTDLSLPEAIHAAAEAGFSAVECHWPYNTAASSVQKALEKTNLPMLGLNTRRGNLDNGDNGVAAIVGREKEAYSYIDESISYAAQISCPNVHVMAGVTGKDENSDLTFQDNLRYACEQAEAHDITILIEPLNQYDAPGYHLSTLEDALDVLAKVNRKNLKIMFDCYHLQIMQGDLTRRLQQNINHIGHIQIAGVPERSEPDEGELHYPNLLKSFEQLGWNGFIGAEYKPRQSTNSGLGWMKLF